MTRFERKEMTVLERRGGVVFLGALVAAVPLAFLRFFGASLTDFLLIVCAAVPLLSLFLTLAAFYRWPKRRTAHVVADSGGLELDGTLYERVGSRDAFAMVLPEGSSAVRLVERLGLRVLTLVVADEREAESILLALRMDVAHATATFNAHDGGQRAQVIRVVVCGLAWMVVSIGSLLLREFSETIGALRPWWLLQGLVQGADLLAYIALFTHYAVRVTVGADGVLVRPYLGRARFIPYADIQGVELVRDDIVLALRSGKSARFGMGAQKITAGGSALLRRLKSGMERRTVADSPPLPSTLLARGDRTAHTWLVALKELADSAATAYRRPAVPADQFWRLVEDAEVPAEIRAGAAVALRVSLDDEGKERLRVASSACASPKLRAAFEAVRWARDEAAVEEALDAVSETDAGTMKRLARR
jgi:hypothetical protein